MVDNKDSLRLWHHIHKATTHFSIVLVFVPAFDTGAPLFEKTNWRTDGYRAPMATVIMLPPTMASGLFGIYLEVPVV